MIDPRLLEILACPVCKTGVTVVDTPAGVDTPSAAGMVPPRSQGWLVCARCGRRYPIRDGIPVMLVEEADGGQPQETVR